MARNLHGKDGAAVALKLFLMLVTLLVVGCRSGCDAAANESSMAPEVVSDRGFALLQRVAIEKVAEYGDQAVRLELLRRDHPSLANWSSTNPPKSSTVRFLDAVKKSKAHRDAITRSMQFATAGPAASSSAEAGWESPPYNNESKLFSIPVSQGEAEFLTRFALGTPAQSFTLILDAESDLVWTQCLPCEPCLSQIGPEFHPADIEVIGCSAAGCEYIYGYADGSGTTGNIATDTMTLGAASVPSLGLGCGHDDQVGDFGEADAVVGFGQGRLSLITQFSNAGVMSKRFSYCFVKYKSENTSPLLLGDPAVFSAPPFIEYTPIQANPMNPSFYYLNLEGIGVAGIPANLELFATNSRSGSGGLILD